MNKYVPSPPNLITAGAIALALGALALVLPTTGAAEIKTAMWIVSAAHLGLGLYVFVVHGGVFVTPTGLYFFSAALLVGGAGLYGDWNTDTVVLVSAGILVGNLGVLAVRMRRTTRSHRPSAVYLEPMEVRAGYRGWVWVVGVTLILTGVAFQYGGSALGPLSGNTAFAGVAMLLLGFSAAATARFRYLFIEVVGAGLGFLTFIQLFFGGFGRLVLVALILCGALAINWLHPRPWHKPGLIVALVPALLVAGIIETTRGQQEENLGRFSVSADEILLEGAGLGSATGPLDTMVEIVESEQAGRVVLERQYGWTFVEALLAPIPRAVWPSKPVGLGFKYSLALTPDLATFGHNLAALAYGEWFVNFGWLGFLIVPPVVATLLGWLDRWHLATLSSGITSRPGFIRVLILLLLVAGIPDYVWVGLFTYVARAGVRALVVVPLLLYFQAVDRSGRLVVSRTSGQAGAGPEPAEKPVTG